MKLKLIKSSFNEVTIGVLALIAVLGIFAYITNYMEFMFYSIFMFIAIFFVLIYHKKLHLSLGIFLMVLSLIILHMIAGFVRISGTRLYDLTFTLFRVDNLMHSYGAVIFALVAYSYIRPYLDREAKHDSLALASIIILLTMGFGAINEVLEFTAVMLFDSLGVGGYNNNMLDLIYNFVGGMAGAAILVYYHLIYVVKKK